MSRIEIACNMATSFRCNKLCIGKVMLLGLSKTTDKDYSVCCLFVLLSYTSVCQVPVVCKAVLT